MIILDTVNLASLQEHEEDYGTCHACGTKLQPQEGTGWSTCPNWRCDYYNAV